MEENNIDYIALYAAVLSTLLALFEFLKYIWNRPKLKITASRGYYAQPLLGTQQGRLVTEKEKDDNPDYEYSEELLRFSAINTSPRPIVVQDWGISGNRFSRGGNSMTFTEPNGISALLPCKLNEKEYCRLYFTNKLVLEKLKEKNIKPKRVYFITSDNKIYSTRKIKFICE
ncbi:MAG: hypothetical protein V1848_01890 [Candidatus Magasanikbacteria bacterium]